MKVGKRRRGETEGEGEKEKLSPTCMVEFRKQLFLQMRSDMFTEEAGPDVMWCHTSVFSDDILRTGIVCTKIMYKKCYS